MLNFQNQSTFLFALLSAAKAVRKAVVYNAFAVEICLHTVG